MIDPVFLKNIFTYIYPYFIKKIEFRKVGELLIKHFILVSINPSSYILKFNLHDLKEKDKYWI